MSIEPIPRLEPIVVTLMNLGLGNYLTSIDFKRLAIKNNFEETWSNAFKYVQNERLYLAIGITDDNYFDSLDALTAILNMLYENNRLAFFNFIEVILFGYTEWSKKDLPVKDLLEDLELLSAPTEIINNITKLANYYSIAVPKVDVPDTVWNSEKLDSFLKKMDKSIEQENYNLTLTYAYSCLEGLYKSFIKEKLSQKIDSTDKLNQLASIVRNHLKDLLVNDHTNYPEQMLQLIPTITSAISNARNGYSESHFDKNADKSLAEFSRDCVNAIGRLIIKFI